MYRTSRVGTILEAFGPAAEGESLATTQTGVSPAMLSLQAQAGGEILLDPSAAGAMQTVRPESNAECPPCPQPTIVYRDRIIEKWRDRPVKVPCPPPTTIYRDRAVPGPATTKIVYIDQSTGQQVAMPAGYPSGTPAYTGTGYLVPPGAGLVSPEPAGAGAGAAGIDTSSSAGGFGGQVVRGAAGAFPWWLLLVGGAVAYALSKKKR